MSVPQFWFRSVGLATLVFGCAGSTIAHGQNDRPPATDRPVRSTPDRPARDGLRLPADVEVVRDVVYATAAKDDGTSIDLLMNTFFPKNSDQTRLPAVIYIHGGGWRSGSREQGDQFSALLARGGYFAATISYRLLPDSKFPACLNDAKAAVRFIRANAEELGIDAEHIGVWGHSAGGHLSAFLGTSGNARETAGDVGDFPHASSEVSCVVDYFGPSDFTTLFGGRAAQRARESMFGDITLEELKDRFAFASPVHWIDADDPPFLILHGTEDRLVPISQSELLREKLNDVGVACELIKVEGAGHGFLDTPTMLATAKFFDEHLGGHAASAVEDVRELLDALGQQRRRQQDRARDANGADGRSEAPARGPNEGSPEQDRRDDDGG